MATVIRLPQLGLTMTEGVIGQWYVREGDTVTKGMPIVSVETDKLTNDVESEIDGIVLKRCAGEGDVLEVQRPLCLVGAAGEEIPSLQEENGSGSCASTADAEPPTDGKMEQACSTQTERTENGRIRVSPLARKTAERAGLDLRSMTGSGNGGRIVLQDVLAAIARDAAPRMTAEADHGVRMSSRRRVIAQRMLASHQQIPAVTLILKADVTELMRLRGACGTECGSKYSVNDFILKAVSLALQAYPRLASSIEDDRVCEHTALHVGMAVSTPDGLVVPVIRNIDRRSLAAISACAKYLAERARNGGLTSDDCTGSNLGMRGVESFTPIINQPEAAILGVGTIETELRLADGAPIEYRVMRLCLTFDHRLLDGDMAADFAAYIKQLLEHPLRLIVERA